MNGLWYAYPGSTLTTATNSLPLLDVYTHTPVMCVRNHGKYLCNSMTPYTHRKSVVTLHSMYTDVF